MLIALALLFGVTAVQPHHPGTPMPAVALFPRANWIVPADTPAAAAGQTIKGAVMFELTFGQDGRVSRCDIVTSSGSALLDMTTCRLSRQRKRVSPSEPHLQFFQHDWR